MFNNSTKDLEIDFLKKYCRNVDEINKNYEQRMKINDKIIKQYESHKHELDEIILNYQEHSKELFKFIEELKNNGTN